MTFLWIVLGLIAFAVVAFVLLWLNAIRASGKRNHLLDEMVAPAIEAAKQNAPEAGEIVTRLAVQSASRNYLHQKLQEIGRAELFPAEYRVLEKIAESDLVGWLMHPNELAAAPVDIELVRSIPVQEEGKSGFCFLFRFRAEESHWAAKRGWMAGMAGPYWNGEEPPTTARDTFSELTPFEEMTEAQHLEHIRASLHKKGLVVPS